MANIVLATLRARLREYYYAFPGFVVGYELRDSSSPLLAILSIYRHRVLPKCWI